MDDFAERFRQHYPDWTEFIDDAEADEHAALLTAHGLGVLNELVLAPAAIGQVLDRIAEHATAVKLLQRSFVDLAHEPPEMRRPVDLVGTHGGRRHAVEVKRLAASGHDDLQGKTMRTLNTALEADKQPVAISVELADAFAATDINALVQHVKATLRRGASTGSHWFPSEHGWLAHYELYPAPQRPHARVGMLGDDLHGEMRDVTGDDQARVRHKVQDAYGKFDRDAVDVTNVLVLQADNTVNLHAISESLYGREYMDLHRGSDEVTVGRYKDGLLSGGRYSALDAVVVGRRIARRLFAPLELALFTNPATRVSPELVAQTLGASAVYGPSDFP